VTTSEFEQLLSSNSGRIRAIAMRYGANGEADDLYQEILEQLWRSFKSFRGESKPETWVYRIGINTAMTRLRKTVKQREAMGRLSEHAQTAITTGDRCQADILQDFINALNDVDASILMMYLDGLSGQEMASVLGININSVQVRINRMRKVFAERYLEAE
jgi:RNA polymerase sigma-70 factor (ECF subfamily)